MDNVRYKIATSHATCLNSVFNILYKRLRLYNRSCLYVRACAGDSKIGVSLVKTDELFSIGEGPLLERKWYAK